MVKTVVAPTSRVAEELVGKKDPVKHRENVVQMH